MATRFSRDLGGPESIYVLEDTLAGEAPGFHLLVDGVVHKRFAVRQRTEKLEFTLDGRTWQPWRDGVAMRFNGHDLTEADELPLWPDVDDADLPVN